MNTSDSFWSFTQRLVTVLALACLVGTTQAQSPRSEPVLDASTGLEIANIVVETGGVPQNTNPVTIHSLQSAQGGVANVGSEASIYHNPDRDPMTYSIFLNYNSTSGASSFPGVFLADDMGLGAGYAPGVDEISSYSGLFFRSSLDAQPGLADFHVELWDGDPFCALDTPANGYSCMPIAGSEADFTDIFPATQFTATHTLPKGVSAPNQRVWMVVSGSETGVNPSPCRLGWDIAWGPGIIGDNHPFDLFLWQYDGNNGADGAGSIGTCCDTGAPCDASALCPGDTDGSRGFCFDDIAETLGSAAFDPNGATCQANAGANCSNFVATINAPATSTISMVPVHTSFGTITGQSVSLPNGPADLELEIRVSSWDPDDEGTLLKAWQANPYVVSYDGLQGYLSPSEVPCTTDLQCRSQFGGVCTITGSDCLVDSDCTLSPIEFCGGPTCYVTDYCTAGFIYSGRADYVFITAGGDLPAVDVSISSYYRYASAVQMGDGVPPPDPFPAGGAYAGTLRLYASADCKGTFSMGFQPFPSSSLVDQDNEFIPLIGFVPAEITCEIGKCCLDLTGSGGCIDNVTAAQCETTPGESFWCQEDTCAEPCITCLQDNECQDGLWCNGAEFCTLGCGSGCFLGTPPSCDDGVACTIDSCIEDGNNDGHCDNIPDDALCDDGVWCNGVETCDPTVGCVSGPAPCDDGVVCTVDGCVEGSQSCSNTPDDSICDNGQWCDGAETCDATQDCQLGTSPCPSGSCDEANDTCVTIGIPTVSTWGFAVLALLLMAGWKVLFGLRRPDEFIG